MVKRVTVHNQVFAFPAAVRQQNTVTQRVDRGKIRAFLIRVHRHVSFLHISGGTARERDHQDTFCRYASFHHMVNPAEQRRRLPGTRAADQHDRPLYCINRFFLGGICLKTHYFFPLINYLLRTTRFLFLTRPSLPPQPYSGSPCFCHPRR